jgi:hypothetical protein
VIYAGIYVTTGLSIGWANTWEVNIGDLSPFATGSPLLAWPLSVLGWLVVPGVAGAVAGYVVTVSIQSRRTESLSTVFPDAHDA